MALVVPVDAGGQPILMGTDRSPHRQYPRNERVVSIDRPATTTRFAQPPSTTFAAPDLVGLPWRRSEAWTDAAFRAQALAFIRTFFAQHPSVRLIGWDVVEKQPSALVVGLTRRTTPRSTVRIEAAQHFPTTERTGAALVARLASLRSALEAAIA